MDDLRYGNSLRFVFYTYLSQITLYRSLYAYWWSILESTIQEISYSGSPFIMTSIEASWILSEKELDVVGLSIDM